jgi:perosamine synthetase
MLHLKAQGIATGCHYTPLSIQPLFAPWGNTCPFVEAEQQRFITLPLHADLTDEEVHYVINGIRVFHAQTVA